MVCILAGRARADDALVVVLGQADKQIVAKEYMNEQKVKLMEKAVEKTLEMDQELLQRNLLQLQQAVVTEERKKAAMRERSRRTKTADINRFKFLCQKCKDFVCRASDIKVVDNAHHIVVDTDFKTRVVYRGHGNPSPMGQDIFFTHKSYCKDCNLGWGIRAIYNGTKVPVLGKGNFIFDENNGEKPTRLAEWNDVPFLFETVTPEDIERLDAVCDELE